MTSPEAVISREPGSSQPPDPRPPKRPLRPLGLASDERLAKRAGRGDADAFAAIFRRYEHDLYRFCVGILGEPQDAQDALQNTMVKVLRALPGERREIQLKPWLYRIAHNEAIELRCRQRPAEQLEPGIADAGLSVDESAERSESLRVLFRDMTDLPQRQRAALVMRELSGLEFGEIGAALGTSPSAVRQALYEARRGLQQMEAGRHMDCDAVTRDLSDEDGRARGRAIRAHLRHCPECHRFRREIGARKQSLTAISPLPAFVTAALLKGSLAGSGAGGAGASGAGAIGVSGGLAAGAAAGSGLAKSVVGVLAVVALGAAAADRGRLTEPRVDRPGTVVERQGARDPAQRVERAAVSRGRAEVRGSRPGVRARRSATPPAAGPLRRSEIDRSRNAVVRSTALPTPIDVPPVRESAELTATAGGPVSSSPAPNAAQAPSAAQGQTAPDKRPAEPTGSDGKSTQTAAPPKPSPKEARGPSGEGGAQAGAKPEKPSVPTAASTKAGEKQANAEVRAEGKQAKAEAKPESPAKGKGPSAANGGAAPAAPAPSASPPPAAKGEAAAPKATPTFAPSAAAAPEAAEAPTAPAPAAGQGAEKGSSGNNGNGAAKRHAPEVE